MMKSRTKHIIYSVALILTSCLVFLLSGLCEWGGDALFYKFSFKDGIHVKGLHDLMISQVYHYFVINGRIWAHVLCQMFSAILGKWVFAACNAVVYLLFIKLLNKYSGVDGKSFVAKMFVLILTLILADMPYTPNCQIGYIWTSTLVLAFLCAYNKAEGGNGYTKWQIAGLIILSVLAGDGNESLCLGLAASLGLDFVFRYRRLSIMQRAMAVFFCVGALLICITPAALQRSESIYRPPLVFSIYNLVVNLRVFYLMLIILVVQLLGKKISLREFYRSNRLMVNAMAVMFVFNMLLTVKGHRQLFGIEFYSAIITMRLFETCRFKKALLIAAGLIVVAFYTYKVIIIKQYNTSMQRLRSEIMACDKGDIYIDLPLYSNMVHPVEYMSYKDNVNLLYHVSALIDDINDVGYFYIVKRDSEEFKRYSRYRLYPEAMREAANGEIHNQYHESDGVYLLMRDKAKPARFVLNREYNILGIKMPMAPYEINFKNEYSLDTDVYNVEVTSFPVPFMRPVGIEIIE